VTKHVLFLAANTYKILGRNPKGLFLRSSYKHGRLKLEFINSGVHVGTKSETRLDCIDDWSFRCIFSNGADNVPCKR
jgi:hypothetical protein